MIIMTSYQFDTSEKMISVNDDGSAYTHLLFLSRICFVLYEKKDTLYFQMV